MGAASKGCFCRFVVLPVVLVLIATAIAVFIKNKVHPSSAPSIPSTSDVNKYRTALSASLQFLQIQKAGRLVNNQIPWRGDSAWEDGKEAGLDLSKGLYEAGDHMKFGLPMAFTATILSWTVLEYDDQLVRDAKRNLATDGLRWITDYLVKAHSADNVLCIQVGDPKIDHSCWDRPESMVEQRPLLFINKTSPGSDVAGETAAALAAASLVFKSSDPTYSDSLLKHAQQLFEFADNYTGIYSVTFPDLATYYNSTDYHDELLWAAAWLYHATGDLKYLNYATDNGQKFKGYGDPTYFSWDDKRAGTQVLLSRVRYFSSGSLPNNINTVLDSYRTAAERVMCILVPGSPYSTTDRTPGGLVWIQEWNSLQHPVAGSFLAAIYSNYMATTQKTDISCDKKTFTAADLRNFAKSQADYILGNNPIKMSYLVGYGSLYPQKVHHRGASIPADEDPSCSDYTWLNSPSRNPNIAIGALVGGPFFNDTYIDKRDNALQGEPTTTSSALFTGLLSGLVSSSTAVKSFT
ncbi:Endoglucanase 24 [Carex littledalei]|uniref:Endoglucanase n=1 Tax=Carex littledalei TaxID=544730 RepID=A0A833QZ27_9POAL|nr:Endoglucanase 24 [Carex littledalei]